MILMSSGNDVASLDLYGGLAGLGQPMRCLSGDCGGLGLATNPAANANVKTLQAVLKSAATTFNDTGMDPGTPDGIVGKRTLVALLRLAPKLPSTVLPSAFSVISNALKNLTSRITPEAIGLLDMTVGGPISTALTAAYKFIDSNAKIIGTAAALVIARAGGDPNAFNPGGGDAVATTGKYPAGSIQRFHKSKMKWRVYVPVGMTLSGAGLSGDTYVAAELDSEAPGVPKGPVEDYFYKQPWFWGAVAGGLVVVGGGAYYVFKK